MSDSRRDKEYLLDILEATRRVIAYTDDITYSYPGINYDIVWTVARLELPSLVPRLEVLLRTLTNQ
jgi:uncharacterized protein with HEPN domain